MKGLATPISECNETLEWWIGNWYTPSKLKKMQRKLLQLNLPPYEKLVGDLAGAYLRRINIQHRLVCEAIELEEMIKAIGMWTHYE